MSKRMKHDSRDTLPEAVAPLLQHIRLQSCIAEPCAGSGELIDALIDSRLFVFWRSDIKPRRRDIFKMNALDITENDVATIDYIITTPPRTHRILHPMIDHLRSLRPTWLLLDSDWMHTKQAAPYLLYCYKIVSIGRVSWMLFDRDPAQTEFFGRAA